MRVSCWMYGKALPRYHINQNPHTRLSRWSWILIPFQFRGGGYVVYKRMPVFGVLVNELSFSRGSGTSNWQEKKIFRIADRHTLPLSDSHCWQRLTSKINFPPREGRKVSRSEPSLWLGTMCRRLGGWPDASIFLWVSIICGLWGRRTRSHQKASLLCESEPCMGHGGESQVLALPVHSLGIK